MKDRLVELIKDIAYDMVSNCGDECDKCAHGDCVGKLADHLLANGVIVLPCKVGTTLYFLYNSPYADKPDLTSRIYKTADWYFEVDKKGIVINTSEIHSFNKRYDYYLGETAFLTYEEAENALERRKG